MRLPRASRWLLLLLAVGLLMLMVPLQEGIHQRRPSVFDPNRKTRPASGLELGPTPAVIASLGGFRTVAADLLWMRMERVWDTGNWFALLPLLDAVTQLDPYFVLAWKVYGWHCAYNLNAESETIVDRKYWLNRGLDILERAVDVNPNSWEMVFELGWTYYDRAHEPYRAAEYIKRAEELPAAPAYVTRMTYRVYEGILDLKNLRPALAYARTRHTEDHQHMYLVNRDTEYWGWAWNNPREHRRIIVGENTARHQRALPYYMYPDDPYWVICPYDGMPTKKGSKTCEYCGRPLPTRILGPTSDLYPQG